MICNIDRFSVNSFEISPIDFIAEDSCFNKKLELSDSFCIFISKIETNIEINKRRHSIPANSIVFVGTGNEVVIETETSIDKSGYLLTFKSSFYEDSAKKDLLLKSRLFYPKNQNVTIIQSKEGVEYVEKFMINRLKLFLENEKYSMYVAAAQSCTEFLILEGLSKTITDSEYSDEHNLLLQYDLTNKFLFLLEKHYKERRDVSFYAELLDVPAWKLSKITEAILQKQAKQIIVEKIVYEAQNLLTNSNNSVTNIARILGFSDRGNFTAFVKKHGKKNPTEYRKNGFSLT